MIPATPPRGGSDTIVIEDIRFYGHHGALPAERTTGGWFSVDVELSLDLAPAALSDDLGGTVDYAAVARRIVEVGTGPSVSLLERLATLLAEALLKEFPVTEVALRVKKLSAVGMPGIPSVRIRRRR